MVSEGCTSPRQGRSESRRSVGFEGWESFSRGPFHLFFRPDNLPLNFTWTVARVPAGHHPGASGKDAVSVRRGAAGLSFAGWGAAG